MYLSHAAHIALIHTSAMCFPSIINVRLLADVGVGPDRFASYDIHSTQQ